MKKTLIYIATVVLTFSACSPRVDDVFENTAVVRLEQNRELVKTRLMNAENGWVMQYFAQSDNSSSDTTKHRGYNFLFKFRNDGTVTIGAPVNGNFKTETSLWDIINDNSTVLTFNSFNSIFHYYSNPDPELTLWNTDGEGVGGDYEFMVLEYNEQENYQLLKGKKQSCYIRLYPLPADEDWYTYFDKINAMDKRLFGEKSPLDFYSGDKHYTLYNGYKHEFRAFEAGADTLGGGFYYGFIVTLNGIRLHDNKLLEAEINRAAFNMTEDGKRLQSVIDPNTYMTVEGSTVFTSDANNGKAWIIDTNSLPASIAAALNNVNTKISAVVANSHIASMRFEGAGEKRMALRIFYSVGGAAANSYDIYYFDTKQEGNLFSMKADSTYSSGSILYEYGGFELVNSFNGTYTLDLKKGFAPSEGIVATKTDDTAFVINMKH